MLARLRKDVLMNKQKLPPLLFQKQNGKVYLTALRELSNTPVSNFTPVGPECVGEHPLRL